MKRILLLLAVSLTTAMAWAVKADPTPIVVTQPDGTRLTVVLHGDEHINWYSTLDGVLLVQTKAGYFVADIDDNGELTATRQLAHDRNERQATELALVEQQPRDRFFAASQQSARLNTSRKRPHSFRTPAPRRHWYCLLTFPTSRSACPTPRSRLSNTSTAAESQWITATERTATMEA